MLKPLSVLIPAMYTLAAATLGLALFVLTVRLRQRRPCWLFGHDKRYLAIEALTLAKDWTCGDHADYSYYDRAGHYFPLPPHKAGQKVYWTRWACRRCPKMGSRCFGHEQDWKIEHEEVVPDTKKWANWSEDK